MLFSSVGDGRSEEIGCVVSILAVFGFVVVVILMPCTASMAGCVGLTSEQCTSSKGHQDIILYFPEFTVQMTLTLQ